MKKNHNFYKSINISAFIKNILILCIFYFFTFQSSFAQLNNDKLKNDKIDKDKLTEQLNNKPFTFMENKGQWPEEVLFMANTKSLRAWITKKAMVFEQFEENKNASNNPFDDTLRNKEIKTHVTGLEFVNPKQVKVQKFNPIITKYNFMIGNDPSKHAKDVAVYENVKIENIYEGIDMKYYFDNGELRYDYIVKPNADPNQIELEIKGGDSFRIVNGELIIETSLNPVIKKELFAYQNDKLDKTKKNKVNSEFTLIGNKLKFNIGNYDKSQELVIDPITQIDFYKYPGLNNGNEPIFDIDKDDEDNIYMCGFTNSSQFPILFGKSALISKWCILVKLDKELDLQYVTFFGGKSNSSYSEYAHAIECKNNKIYIFGTTGLSSPDFPITTQNYYNSLIGSQSDYFIVFNLYGNNILYCTYLRTVNEFDHYGDIKVNSSGDVFIAGTTYQQSTPPFIEYKNITTQTRTPSGSRSYGYIYCFSENTTIPNILNYDLKFSSLFGGGSTTILPGGSSTYITTLDIDNSNNIYIAGDTYSDQNTFNTTTNSYQPIKTSLRAAFVSKLSFNGTNLLIDYNTYFNNGTNGINTCHIRDILYHNNKVSIAGQTANCLPLKNSFDITISDDFVNAFVSTFEFNNNGVNDLIYSSFFTGDDVSQIIDLDYDVSCDNILFTGYTLSPLVNYQYTLNMPFYNGGTYNNCMNGAINVNNIGVNTLVSLAYFGNNPNENYKIRSYYSILYDKNNDNIINGCSPNFCIGAIRFSKDKCQETCPCPADKDSWLTVNATKGAAPCSPDQCKVSVNLEIPQQYRSCFPYYSSNTYEVGIGGQLEAIQSTTSFNSSAYTKCISAGVVYKITIKLYRGLFDLNPCIITKDVMCPVNEPAGVPCIPDCPEDLWTTQQPIEVDINCMGEPCKLFVNYVSRKACGGAYQDIQITSIDKVNTNASNSNGCNACSDADAFKAAFEEIVRQNNMNFNPNNKNQPCSETWRVSQASCWSKYYSLVQINGATGGTPIYMYITKYRPCNTTCCLRRFRICRNQDNTITITELYSDANSQECTDVFPPSIYEFGETTCFNSCNFLEGIDDIIGNKTSEEFNQELYENLSKEEIVSFTYFNDNNNLTLNLEINKLDNFEIKIYDLNGILIKSKIFNKTEITNNLVIDISSLKSNMYVFEILTNNNKIFDGKFIKIKE